jgi:hypothetical protein
MIQMIGMMCLMLLMVGGTQDWTAPPLGPREPEPFWAHFTEMSDVIVTGELSMVSRRACSWVDSLMKVRCFYDAGDLVVDDVLKGTFDEKNLDVTWFSGIESLEPGLVVSIGEEPRKLEVCESGIWILLGREEHRCNRETFVHLPADSLARVRAVLFRQRQIRDYEKK